MQYKFKGRVHYVSPVQTFGSGFAKRMLVLEEESSPDGKWRNFAAFEFVRGSKQDKTRELDGLQNGEVVEVTFFPSARENQNSPGQWFPSNRGTKVERMARPGDPLESVFG